MTRSILLLLVFGTLFITPFALAFEIPENNMTSNNAPTPYSVWYGEVLAGGTHCYKAFDGNDSTPTVGECQLASTASAYVAIDLGKNYIITNYTLYSQYNVGSGLGTARWSLNASFDNVTWVTIAWNGTTDAWTTKRTYAVNGTSGSGPFRYLMLTNMSTGNNHIFQTLSFTSNSSTNDLLVGFLDEETRSPPSPEETATLQMIGDELINNQSYSFNLNTSANKTLPIIHGNYTLSYSAPSYDPRVYYGFTFSNDTPNNITLYLINSSSSSEILVSVLDTTGQPIEGAIIKLTRFFPGCGCYELVETAQTGFDGTTLVYVKALTAFYRWAIEVGGQTVFLSSNGQNIFSTTRDFTISLNDKYYESYSVITSIASSIAYNTTTGVLVWTFDDPVGIVTSWCLSADALEGNEFVTKNNSCTTTPTGTLTITLDNQTTHRYKGAITTNTEYSSYTTESGWLNGAGFVFGTSDLGGFLALGVMVVLAMIFSFSSVAVLLITSLGAFVLSFTGILPLNQSFLVAFATLTVGLSLFMFRK